VRYAFLSIRICSRHTQAIYKPTRGVESRYCRESRSERICLITESTRHNRLGCHGMISVLPPIMFLAAASARANLNILPFFLRPYLLSAPSLPSIELNLSLCGSTWLSVQIQPTPSFLFRPLFPSVPSGSHLLPLFSLFASRAQRPGYPIQLCAVLYKCIVSS
jgi:hypothetical protein